MTMRGRGGAGVGASRKKHRASRLPNAAACPQSQGGTNLRQRAQALEAARHGGGKAALAPQRREDQAVLRAVRLVGAVRAAKLLDRFVG